ncbi:MAG TPA: AMP-binding protein [Vicinamibacterales bacterium]|nr:AMP-binding protein [Vicinamibacterales bacterium]
MRNTLVDLFRDLDTQRGECVVYDDGYRVRRHSYRAVTAAARVFAARLAAEGIAQGDKVILWGENRPEWMVGYWGCVIAGVVAVPIDYRASPTFLLKVHAIVEARLVVVGDDVAAAALGAEVVTWRFHEVRWEGDAPMPAVAISRDDISQIVFTSGATADPKGVVIRHRNILANVIPVEAEVRKYKRYARPFLPLRFLNLLPLSHLFGQSMAMSIPPMVDGTVVFMRSFNPHDIVRMVKTWRISVIVCVPKILDVLKEHALRVEPAAADKAVGRMSIPSRWWRYRAVHRMFGLKFWAFIVGAAPLPPPLEEFWKRLGFVVIQGYGLTETAPIVTLNHPFKTTSGSVGTPVAGVEVRIAEDGEILVRGENVTTGYYGAAGDRGVDEDGWLHTGDIGEIDAAQRVFIKGRKKEMIVTPDGLNVFPEDVERALEALPSVTESAVIAHLVNGEERVYAVLVMEPGADPEVAVRAANQSLQDHQRIRGHAVWTDGPLPRTDGTNKLKRQALRAWVATGMQPTAAASDDDPLAALLRKFAGQRVVGADTSLDDLGLSSLERVELMVAIEDRLQTRIDETQFATAKTLADVRVLLEQSAATPLVAEPVDFPRWNRHGVINQIRRLSQIAWILPLARYFARTEVRGLEHLVGLRGPVVFAANHQSHFDGPVILGALPDRVRTTIAPAMSKEFFKAHFFPEGQPRSRVLLNRAFYYLAAFFFNAFPLPQREAGARQTLRYIGEVTADGYSVLIFPEGVRSETGDIAPFRGGIGMIASRLALPVIPVRLEGVDKILPVKSRRPTRGRVRVTFGPPIHLTGDDYQRLAQQVEEVIRNMA